MPYKKKDIKFIRFGDLNPIKQHGYKKDTFHSAPVSKGFYAFVEFMIEPFLLGGYNPIGTKHSKRQYVKDKDGNKVIIGKFYEDKDKPPLDEWDEHYEWVIFLDDDSLEKVYKRYAKQKNLFFASEMHKNGFIYLHTMKKPKRFKYTGEIWHHFGEYTPNHLILQRSKEWVLTDFKTYVDAFNKALLKTVAFKTNWTEYGDKYKQISTRYKQFSKDDFEVFIERL